jgi:probable F420-dependent oxidoreductase
MRVVSDHLEIAIGDRYELLGDPIMHIGVTFPTLEIGTDPTLIRDYAQAVEDLGYHHILLLDHVVGFDRPDFVGSFGPMTHSTLIHEPLTLLSFLAACTQRIELVTGVLVLPQRQTVLVAKQAAEVDVLSGGRLRLGIGVGWIPAEFEALDQEYHNRGLRSEEQIAVLRALWTEPTITFHGRWHHLEAAGINPQPVQRPIPIWIGGYADPALRRVARIGDGWMAGGAPDSQAQATLDRLRGYVAEVGRPPAAVGVHALLVLGQESDMTWEAQVAGWRALGATHLSLDTMRVGLAQPQDHIKMLRRMKQVLDG